MLVLGGRERRSSILLALDRSLRSIDADGHMRVEESRISKANICPYLGREIPGWQELGLDPERTYRLFRDPKELEKGASTFDGKPLLIKHVPIDADEPKKELWVGTVGQVKWEAPYLVARPLMVLTKEAIDLIESKQQRELSAAYRYDAVMESGAWGGESYDGRMVNIRGNHVAIVSEGRVGPDVHVADALPPELRRMSRNATLAASLASVLASVLPADADRRKIALALDGALGETPAESVLSLDAEELKAAEDAARDAKRKASGDEKADLDEEEREKAYERARDKKAKDKKAKDKKAHDKRAAEDKKAAEDAAARDAALDAREAAMDAKEEAEDEGKESEECADRKRARDARKQARDKRAKDRGAHDALPDNTDHRRDFRSNAEDAVSKDEMNDAVKTAVESERKRSTAAAVAREKVRPIVGVVSMALDNAPDIYRFALKHAQVKTEGVHDSALESLIDMAVDRKRSSPSPVMATDAAARELTDIDALFRPKAA